MPAHTTEDSYEHKCTSLGEPVTEDLWLGNQFVDLLAKQGAQSMQHCALDISRFVNWEKQVKELVIFLGQLTHEASSNVGPDGVVCRDCDGLQCKRKPRSRVPKSSSPARNQVV